MNLRYLLSTAAALAALTALPSWAHDPKEHMKEGEAPDCAAMEHMNQGSMKSDDPVMQAMMKQCADAKHEDAEAVGHEHGGNHVDPTTPAQPPSQSTADDKHEGTETH